MKRYLMFALIAISAAMLISAVPIMQKAKVKKIVNGTSIDAEINGKIHRVALIGVGLINAVDGKTIPNSDKLAILFMKKHLEGKEIRLSADTKLPEKDKSGNMLRYVYFGGNKFFNLFIIKQGYALTDVKIKFDAIAKFKDAEKKAKAASSGIWGLAKFKQTAADNTAVFVTKAGIKYHKKGCVALKKGTIQITLKEAREKGYLPCNKCKPAV